MCIRPLASICGSRVSCGSITATPEDRDCRCAAWRRFAEPRRGVALEAGRADVAQHRVIAGLVGLVERKQRRADQDDDAVAIDLRGLGRLRLLLRRRRLLLRNRSASAYRVPSAACASAIRTGSGSCACGGAPDTIMTVMTPAARLATAITPVVDRRSKEVMDLLSTTTRRSRQPECPIPPYWNPQANPAFATPPAPKRLPAGRTRPGVCFLRRKAHQNRATPPRAPTTDVSKPTPTAPLA